MTLETRPVDPRDVSIEESDPTYRVYFWSNDGGRCREFDAVGADEVGEVIAWADASVRKDEHDILGIRWEETPTPPGSAVPSVVFIPLKGDPPPGQSIGNRLG